MGYEVLTLWGQNTVKSIGNDYNLYLMRLDGQYPSDRLLTCPLIVCDPGCILIFSSSLFVSLLRRRKRGQNLQFQLACDGVRGIGVKRKSVQQ